MIKVFVLDVIESLPAPELERLMLFLESPYFNKSSNRLLLLQLYKILSEAIQNETIDALEKQDVYQKLFPGKPLVESKIDKLMSELKRLVEDFLVTEHFLSKDNEQPYSLALIQELRQRRLDSRYHQATDRNKKEIGAKPKANIWDFLFLHQLALEEHEWHSAFNKFKGDLNIPEVLHHLDNYYAAVKTEMLNRLLLQQRVTLLSPETTRVINLLWEIPTSAKTQHPLIDIPWKIHLILKEEKPTIEGFQNLLAMLQQRETEIESETLSQYYTYLRNICISLINEGHSEFFEILHLIQKDNLERGYYYYQERILPGAFLNITQIALSVQAFEWANNFVESHKDLILGDKDETADFYLLNKALCFFAEKKYDEALSILPFGSSYSAYHLTARRLELKIYYELKSDLLEFKIDAFKMFISRAGQKVLSKDLYETFVSFINILRQLNQSFGIQDKNRSEQLIKRIQEKALLADRPWLLEKAREIGERRK